MFTESLGKLIVLEGLDGSGKSTLLPKLVNTLNAILGKGQIVVGKEPGSTPLGLQIREWLLSHSKPSRAPSPITELLLLYAARRQLLEKIVSPALQEGKWVILDRHDLSTQAYQGAGRGLPLQLIQTISRYVVGDLKPDLTLYLSISPKLAYQRRFKRTQLDCIEQEPPDFFERVYAYYEQCSAQDVSIIRIDASRPLPAVEQEALGALYKKFFPSKPSPSTLLALPSTSE